MIFITLLMLTATSIAANSSTLTSAKHAPLTSAKFASPTSIFVRPIKVLVILCAVAGGLASTSSMPTQMQLQKLDQLYKNATMARLVLALPNIQYEDAVQGPDTLVKVPVNIITSLSITLREVVRLRNSYKEVLVLANSLNLLARKRRTGPQFTQKDASEVERESFTREALEGETNADDAGKQMTTLSLMKIRALASYGEKAMYLVPRIGYWGSFHQLAMNLFFILDHLLYQLDWAIRAVPNESIPRFPDRLATMTKYLGLISRPSANTQL